MFYGIRVREKANGKFEVSCRDLPGFISQHQTKEEAMEFARQFVPGVMTMEYRRKRKAIPLPTEIQDGEIAYYVPAKVQAKILFWNLMMENHLKIADVARKLEIAHSEAARFVDLSKDSASIDNIERALLHLGYSFTLQIKPEQ